MKRYTIEDRFSVDTPPMVLRSLWKKYWKTLDNAKISETAELYRYFANDVFYCTELRNAVIFTGFDTTGETFVQLGLRNEYANQQCRQWLRGKFVGESLCDPSDTDRLDELTRMSGWNADDFYTTVTFRGIDELEFDLPEDGCQCDYRHATIIPRNGRIYMALYFSAVAIHDAKMYFRFDSLSVEDISPRLRTKYAGWEPRLFPPN